MNCELCGKEVVNPKKVMVEGSTLHVCDECSSYGKEVLKEKKDSSSDVMNRLEKNKKRRSSKEVYGETQKELAIDYPEKIRDSRQEKELTQEELSKKINEKKSIINKLEKADMRPSDELRKKLERVLDIDLMEEIEDVHPSEHNDSEGLTIGDLIKEE